MADNQQSIEGEILSLIDMENKLAATKAEISKDPQIARFFELEKQVKETSKVLNDKILEGMTAAHIKKIEGDWGMITVVERQAFDVDADSLPDDYKRMQPDLKKIGNYYSLTGEAPEGVKPKITRFLRKTLNKENN